MRGLRFFLCNQYRFADYLKMRVGLCLTQGYGNNKKKRSVCFMHFYRLMHFTIKCTAELKLYIPNAMHALARFPKTRQTKFVKYFHNHFRHIFFALSVRHITALSRVYHALERRTPANTSERSIFFAYFMSYELTPARARARALKHTVRRIYFTPDPRRELAHDAQVHNAAAAARLDTRSLVHCREGCFTRRSRLVRVIGLNIRCPGAAAGS